MVDMEQRLYSDSQLTTFIPVMCVVLSVNF